MSEISWWWTDFGQDQIDKISESIKHGYISQGSVTAEFESRITDILQVPYVVATTNGSTALLMALLAAGVGPGDEVIVPNRTWIATAHAPLLLGATVVLVDVEPGSTNMDTAQLQKKLTTQTKAIMPVHLNGRSAAMGEINRIASECGVTVIEDAAQAFCSRNINGFLGTESFAGCFSMALGKLISTGQGGFVVTRDEQTFNTLTAIRSHGLSDVIDVTYNVHPGFNFKYTDIHASMAIPQLDQLPKRINRVREIYERYVSVMDELPFLKFLPVNLEAGEIPIYNEVLCSDRNKLVQFLDDHNIQARPFAPDLNLATYFGNTGRYPNSEIFGNQGLCLPCGPGQSLDNIDRVIDALFAFRDRVNHV